MRPVRRSHRLSTRDQNRRSEAWANSDAFAGLEESNPYEDEGKKCELHTYERRFNTRGEPILLQSSCRSELGMEGRSSTEAALILTRFYTLERDLETTQLAIQSPFIKAALKAVVKSYPGINIESNGPIYINGEPRCLFYYRDELRDYASILQDKTAEEHINFCLEYMSRTLHREILAYENMMQGESLITGLDFHNLWMVFKPGRLLCCLVKHEVVISRLREMHKRKNDDGSEFWCIYAETLCCNGSVFGYRYQKSNIEYYDGYRPLTELVIYPLDHHKESEKIRIDMIARGKKFISLFGAHHCIYNGSAELLYSNRSCHSREASLVQHRIMVDSKEYNDNVIPESMEFITGTNTIRPELDEHLNLNDETLLVCEQRVPGFSLSKKEWGFFSVAGIRPVEYNKNAFENLILPSTIKNMLASLIVGQKSGTSQFDDFIEGKGKGLIILLHGLPGVGKTFTAESIADFSQRPLYSVGSRDLPKLFGIDEQRLTNSLELASKWNSVVLFDEADVFMQERNENEMFRNELVSVLLRTLEYFEGIMILTTNRVDAIDPAFKSRIHLALTYPALSMKARSELWETLILKAMAQHRPSWLNARFLDKLSKEEVNGREIKNIVRVAHDLAAGNKRAMEPANLIQGLEALKTFQSSFSEAVAKRRLHDDQFAPSSKKRKSELPF